MSSFESSDNIIGVTSYFFRGRSVSHTLLSYLYLSKCYRHKNTWLSYNTFQVTLELISLPIADRFPSSQVLSQWANSNYGKVKFNSKIFFFMGPNSLFSVTTLLMKMFLIYASRTWQLVSHFVLYFMHVKWPNLGFVLF